MVSKAGKSKYLSKRIQEDISEISADRASGKRSKESAEEIIDLLEQYLAMSWSN